MVYNYNANNEITTRRICPFLLLILVLGKLKYQLSCNQASLSLSLSLSLPHSQLYPIDTNCIFYQLFVLAVLGPHLQHSAAKGRQFIEIK